MSLFTEFKRRNVFRVGIAYLVVAWLIVQIVNNLVPILNAPDWTSKVVLIFLIAGFPVSLVIAWAFELTPDGIKRSTVAAKIVLAETMPVERAPLPAASPATPSIAVLPFVDMSPDKNQEYFSDGLSEELLNKLTGLKGLRVAGRTSSFYFKGKNENLRVIGETLGVAHILEGSVRKAGDKIRVTAQLIDARDDTHLWSNTYDRTLDDIFAIQDEIAEGVARALSVTLGVGELGHIEGMTRNVVAYDAYLKGRPWLAGRISLVLLRSQIDSLEHAVRLDPSFALAWAALAGRYLWCIRYDNPRNAANWARRSEEALAKAIELTPDTVQVMSQSAVAALGRKNWIEADRIFRKAIDLHGEMALAFAYSSTFLVLTGQARKALDRLIEARRVEPLNVEISVILGATYAVLGRTHEALEECDRGDALGAPNYNLRAIATIVALGRRDPEEISRRVEALSEVDDATGPLGVKYPMLLDPGPEPLAELRRVYADTASSPPNELMRIAIRAAYFGDPALALAVWNDVFAGVGYYSIPPLLWMPLFHDMRRLPAFKDFVRRIGLVEYWRKTGDWGDFCHPVGDDDFECS